MDQLRIPQNCDANSDLLIKRWIQGYVRYFQTKPCCSKRMYMNMLISWGTTLNVLEIQGYPQAPQWDPAVSKRPQESIKIERFMGLSISLIRSYLVGWPSGWIPMDFQLPSVVPRLMLIHVLQKRPEPVLPSLQDMVTDSPRKWAEKPPWLRSNWGKHLI